MLRSCLASLSCSDLSSSALFFSLLYSCCHQRAFKHPAVAAYEGHIRQLCSSCWQGCLLRMALSASQLAQCLERRDAHLNLRGTAASCCCGQEVGSCVRAGLAAPGQ
jgi:hypothetical protein